MTSRYETDDEVGDRLRRTFARRAGDMAVGDGALWRAVGGPPPAPAPGDPVDGPALAGPGRADAAVRATRRRRPALAVAASLLVLGGVAAVAVTRQAGTGDAPGTTDPGAATAADVTATTAPPTTTTLPPGGTYTFGAFERPPLGVEWVTATFEAGATGAQADIPAVLGPQFQPIQAGPNRGYVVDGPDTAIWLQFEDGIVRLQSGGMQVDELTAVAATVGKDATTGRYTVPTPEGWVDIPELLEPVGDASATPPEQEPVGLGRFVGPGGASFNALWYPGWTTDDLPAGAEPVDVADGQAYVGSIAPAAGDLLQLWVAYDDGVVELQAAGMSRDDLVAAGNGVTRRPGTDDFTLTPPPGYTAG